jgi:hypothetical protein
MTEAKNAAAERSNRFFATLDQASAWLGQSGE